MINNKTAEIYRRQLNLKRDRKAFDVESTRIDQNTPSYTSILKAFNKWPISQAFKLQLFNFVHFLINALRKGLNILILYQRYVKVYN